MTSRASKPLIYVSSTFVDLAHHRAALKQSLEKAQYDVECMEKYPAFDERPLDKCLADVAACDLYVLLLAHRYGYVPNEGNPDALSITELEYRQARTSGKPCLVFCIDDDHAWSPRWIDREPAAAAAMQAFKQRVGERHGRSLFTTADSLAKVVMEALSAHRTQAVHAGPPVAPALAVSVPRPCDLPPAAGHFVGRADALAELVRRLRAGQTAAVVGIGGVGKTALAAAALRQVVGESGERLAASPWPDGLVLLDLYVHRGQAEPAWHALADRLKGADFLPKHAAVDRAAQAVKDQRLLIVIEGAEQADGAEGRVSLPDLQGPLGSACRWLVLTRLLSQADADERILLDEWLNEAEAGELLDELTRRRLPPDVRTPVLALLQGHPLALTWAGKLLARGDEDPRWLLTEWQAGHLPPLADPKQGHHTLAWLFDRSISRLDDAARAALGVAGCLAPTAISLSAFAAAMGEDERSLRAALRSLVQHGLLRRLEGSGQWQFAHALAYGYAKSRCVPPTAVPQALATWVMKTLRSQLGHGGCTLDAAGATVAVDHVAALLRADAKRHLWADLLVPSLYEIDDRLMNLGWSALAESNLSAVEQGLNALTPASVPEADLELARSALLRNRADLCELRGDLSGAERAYRASLTLRERLVQADPSNGQRQRDLSICKINIGDVLRDLGDLRGAENVYRASLAVLERLALADPSNAQWLRDLSASQQRLGDVLCDLGDPTGAENAYRASLAELDRLAQVYPRSGELLRDLSFIKAKLGHVLRAQGDLSGAESAYQASLAGCERLAQADPHNAQWLCGLSSIQSDIGDVLMAQRHPGGAESAYRASLAGREWLAQADPSNAQWQCDLSVSQEKIGDVLCEQGDLGGAERAYRASLAGLERLAQAFPSNPKWQRSHYVSLWKISGFLLDLGQRDEATSMATLGSEMVRRLSELDPINAIWRADVAVWQALLARLAEPGEDSA